MIIGGNSQQGPRSVAGYDLSLGRGRAVSSNFISDNLLSWSSGGSVTFNNEVTWARIILPFNPVESNEITYAKKLQVMERVLYINM